MSKSDENDRVMLIRRSHAKVAVGLFWACMHDTFARAHSVKRARDDRVSCIQILGRKLAILVTFFKISTSKFTLRLIGKKN